MRQGKSKGSIKRAVPLWPRPDPLDEDELAGLEEAEAKALKVRHSLLEKVAKERIDERIDVLMIGRQEVIELRHRYAQIWEERPKPDTLEWIDRWRDLHTAVVIACVRGVYGMAVDGKEIGAHEDGRTIAALLDQVDMTALIDVSRAALRAQDPTKEENHFLELSVA